MANFTRATPLFLATTLILGSSAAYADHGPRNNDVEDLLLNVASAFLVTQTTQHATLVRNQRSRHGHEYRRDRDNPARGFSGRNSNRDGYSQTSFTSDSVRGGSSRRTRIIENPYPNRPVTGVSFTGIDHDAAHINDVIIYPRKRLISYTGYSLSLHHPSQFFNTREYVDYISVKAKRKEYFTVTFHYE